MSEPVVVEVDDTRSVGVSRVEHGESVVLVVEDPHSVAVVEMTMPQAETLVGALRKAIDNG